MSSSQANGNGHAATSSDNSAPSTGKIQPNDVGWQFVPQYYKFVNKEPHRLHLFYTKQSSFVHGEEGDDEAPIAHGQQKIHERINEIGYDQCKVYVHSIDSQSSAGGGIIIQVIGEMSNANGPWRKFAQTFFLAEQPNGYFVLNDIFRYLKEEGDFDEEEQEEVAAEEPVPAAPSVPATPSVATASEPVAAPAQPEPSPAPVEAPAAAIPEPQPTAAASTPEPVSVPSASMTDAVPVEAAVAAVPDKDIAPNEPAAVEVPVVKPEVAAPAPAAEGPASVTETKAVSPNGTARAPAPAPAAAPAAQAAPAAPAKPKSWAWLAASGKPWGSNATPTATTSSAAPISAPAAASAATSQKKTESAASTAPAAGSSGQPRHPAYEAALKYAGTACFVKLPNWQPDSQSQGQTEVIDEALLRNVASKFGEVSKVEIVKDKACAFVEFTQPAFARKAIIASLNVNQGGEGGVMTDAGRIAFENRKEKDERGPSKGGRRGGEQGSGGRHGGGAQRAGGAGGSKVSSGPGGEGGERGAGGRGGGRSGGRGRGGAAGGPSGDRTPANK